MIKIELNPTDVMELLKLIETAESIIQLRKRELSREVVRYNEWEAVFKKLSEHLQLTKDAKAKLFMELLTQYKDDNG